MVPSRHRNSEAKSQSSQNQSDSHPTHEPRQHANALNVDRGAEHIALHRLRRPCLFDPFREEHQKGVVVPDHPNEFNSGAAKSSLDLNTHIPRLPEIFCKVVRCYLDLFCWRVTVIDRFLNLTFVVVYGLEKGTRGTQVVCRKQATSGIRRRLDADPKSFMYHALMAQVVVKTFGIEEAVMGLPVSFQQ